MSMKKGEVYSARKIYGATLAELGETRDDIVVLDADLSCSTMTETFAKKFPERFFNAGIAEQDAICMAAGLATCSKTVFVSTFAMFATGRAYDQIRNSVVYSNLNVKLVATHGGITVGEDGASHQALEDVALMRSIPKMEIFVPADAVETKAIIKFVSENKKPSYVRLPRTNIANVHDEDDFVFEPYKSQILRVGKDLTIITNGETVMECLNIAETLASKGIEAEIINAVCLKPFDAETLINSAKKTNFVVSVENHSINNGLGSVVCETLCENYPCKAKRIGIRDVYGQSGEQRELMHYYRLASDELAEDIIKLVQ